MIGIPQNTGKIHFTVSSYTGRDLLLPFLPSWIRLWVIARKIIRSRKITQLDPANPITFATLEDGTHEIVGLSGRTAPFPRD